MHKTNDLKHKVMISPGSSIQKEGKPDFHTIDLNFHSTYWLALFFGLLNTHQFFVFVFYLSVNETILRKEVMESKNN
jgi:hypothetical protein